MKVSCKETWVPSTHIPHLHSMSKRQLLSQHYRKNLILSIDLIENL
jgi:hypothetical protein